MGARIVSWQPGKLVVVAISDSATNLLAAVGGTVVAGVLGFATLRGTSFAEASPGPFLGLLIVGAVVVGLAVMRVASMRTARTLTLDWAPRAMRLDARGGSREWPFAEIEAIRVAKEIVFGAETNRRTRTIVRLSIEVVGRAFELEDGYEGGAVSSHAQELAKALEVPLR